MMSRRPNYRSVKPSADEQSKSQGPLRSGGKNFVDIRHQEPSYSSYQIVSTKDGVQNPTAEEIERWTSGKKDTQGSFLVQRISVEGFEAKKQEETIKWPQQFELQEDHCPEFTAGSTNLLHSMRVEGTSPEKLLEEIEAFLVAQRSRKSVEIGQSGLDYQMMKEYFKARGRVWLDHEGAEFQFNLFVKPDDETKSVFVEIQRRCGNAWVFFALWQEWKKALAKVGGITIHVSRVVYGDDELASDSDEMDVLFNIEPESDSETQDDEAEVDEKELDAQGVLLSPGTLSPTASLLESPPLFPSFKEERQRHEFCHWDIPLAQNLLSMLDSGYSSHQRHAVAAIADAVESDQGRKIFLEATQGNLGAELCKRLKDNFDPFFCRSLCFGLNLLVERDSNSKKQISQFRKCVEDLHAYWTEPDSGIIPSTEICTYAKKLLNSISTV